MLSTRSPDCPDGYFGVACGTPCNCRDACDDVTGECPGQNCMEGWTGSDCQTGEWMGYNLNFYLKWIQKVKSNVTYFVYTIKMNNGTQRMKEIHAFEMFIPCSDRYDYQMTSAFNWVRHLNSHPKPKLMGVSFNLIIWNIKYNII